MQCQSCNEPFSVGESHQPRVLVTCGHSQCSSCINKSIINQKVKCQECGKITQGVNINQYPVNATLLSVISTKNNDSSIHNSNSSSLETKTKELCTSHGQKLEAYCEKCNQLLCLNCVINSQQHKSHKISPISEKVEKDRAILKQASKNIHSSQLDIQQMIKIHQEAVHKLSDEYKDSLFEIGICFNQIKQLLKQIQNKCLEQCKTQFQNCEKNLINTLQQLKQKHQFFHQLTLLYQETNLLPNIQYLHEDTKRVFIMENSKLKKPKSSAILETINQNKLNYSKICTYNQILTAIQELLGYQKKMQSQLQTTPALKNKKSKNLSNGGTNRQPTILEVNLNEQYQKYFKSTGIENQFQNIFSKNKSINTNNGNSSQNNINDAAYASKVSKSLKTPRTNKDKYPKVNKESIKIEGSSKVSSNKKQEQQESKCNQSIISMYSGVQALPVSAVNSFMGNSQISFQDMTPKNHNRSHNQSESMSSLSLKGTDADFTMYSLEQKIYLFGSFSCPTVQALKIHSDDIDNISLQPTSLNKQQPLNITNKNQGINRCKSQCAIIQSYNPSICLIFGGKSQGDEKLDSFIEYDLHHNEIRDSLFKLSEPKSGFGSIVKENKIYIAGGSNPKKSLKTFEQYRISTVGLARVDFPCMNFSRDQLGMTLGYDGNIYVCGGINQSGTVLSSCERYNWQKKKWQILPSMKKARRAFSLVAMPHGIYAIGGYDGNQYLNNVQLFDFTLGKWINVTPMQKARFAHTASVTSDMQHIIVCGGFNKYPLKSCQAFNVITGKWVFGFDLKQERFLHCSLICNL